MSNELISANIYPKVGKIMKNILLKTSASATGTSSNEDKSFGFSCRRLINNAQKKVTLIFVLFFLLLADSELNVLFFNAPDFNQLAIAEGKIKVQTVVFRTGAIDFLIINNQKIPFDCGLPGVTRRSCQSLHATNYLQGKNGKIWWYKDDGRWNNSTRIYQLEVDNKTELEYQKQKEQYLEMKSDYLYPYTMLFFISVGMFVLTQFANDPKK